MIAKIKPKVPGLEAPNIRGRKGFTRFQRMDQRYSDDYRRFISE